MTTEDVLSAARRAVERAGWPVEAYAPPGVLLEGDQWGVMSPPDAAGSLPHVTVWIDRATGDPAGVTPIRWPPGLPVTTESFLSQADLVAEATGWPIAEYEKSGMF